MARCTSPGITNVPGDAAPSKHTPVGPIATREWRFIDKSEWPAGEWHDEPDKIQWTDEATGLPCLIHRAGSLGHLCGYVGVPEGHTWFSTEYDQCKRADGEWVEVHGGLTFSDFCKPAAENGRGIWHIVEPDQNDRVWWIGFDCGHSGDESPGSLRYRRNWGETYKALGFVKSQVRKLAKQAAEVSR